MDSTELDRWRKIGRIASSLRQAAKLIDEVYERETIPGSNKSVPDALRSMADEFDQLRPSVEQDEAASCVISMETGERLT